VHVSDLNDTSIPVLHDILVLGDPAQARHAAGSPALAPVRPVHPAHEAAPESAFEFTPEPAHAPAAAESAFAPSAGVFDRAEPLAPPEAGSEVPPDVVQPAQAPAPSHQYLDADVIAERLRGRFAGFLSGEGRGIVEARCRDALQDHSTWLINQITREVALALETEMTGWVREAVDEELARRTSDR
jgi:Protein of unknown function (DUF2486)